MEHDVALKHLEQVRKTVDGDVAELVDALAGVIQLQKDITHPMLGAKVTLYQRPPTEEKVRVPEEDAPDPNGDEWNWQWMHYNKDGEAVYKHKPKVKEDDPDLIEHQALVIESDVSGNAPDGDLWDPNREEYKTADEYPLGTVNVIAPAEPEDDGVRRFTEGYQTDVEVFTSITPVNGEPGAHQYTPGWE